MTLSKRRGNILVLVVVGAMMFLSLVGLVVDVGSWYNERAQLQALADLSVETLLRSYPEDPTGESARKLLRRILLANGVRPESASLQLRDGNQGLRLHLMDLSPRRFTAGRGRGPQELQVMASALRSAEGEVALVP